MYQQLRKSGRRIIPAWLATISLLVGSAVVSAQTGGGAAGGGAAGGGAAGGAQGAGAATGGGQTVGAPSGSSRLNSGTGPFSAGNADATGQNGAHPMGGIRNNNGFGPQGITNQTNTAFGNNNGGVSTSNPFGATMGNPLARGFPGGANVPFGQPLFNLNQNTNPNASAIRNVANSVSGGQIPDNLANNLNQNGQFPNNFNPGGQAFNGFPPSFGVGGAQRGLLPRMIPNRLQALGQSLASNGQIPVSGQAFAARQQQLLEAMMSLPPGTNVPNELVPGTTTNPNFPQQ